MTQHIVQAIESLSNGIRADPAKARAKGVPATARLVEGLRCEVTSPRGDKVFSDMPPPMGGAGSAPNPGWYMRGAVAACAATTIATRAAREGIALTKLEVTVETESDHRGYLGMDDVSAGFSELRIKVTLGAPGVPRERLLEIATWGEGHSPVGCTVRTAPRMSVDIEVG